MAWRAPRSLTTFCRDILPLLQEYAQVERLLQTVGQVVATDRWKVDYARLPGRGANAVLRLTAGKGDV